MANKVWLKRFREWRAVVVVKEEGGYVASITAGMRRPTLMGSGPDPGLAIARLQARLDDLYDLLDASSDGPHVYDNDEPDTLPL